ncbi:MAG: hypothetical protein ACFFCW_18830 [Candidatus Hodarchaeota archaeon]
MFVGDVSEKSPESSALQNLIESFIATGPPKLESPVVNKELSQKEGGSR